MSNPPKPNPQLEAPITKAATVPTGPTNPLGVPSLGTPSATHRKKIARLPQRCRPLKAFAVCKPRGLPVSLCWRRIQHPAVVPLKPGVRHWTCSEQYRAPLSASEQYRA